MARTREDEAGILIADTQRLLDSSSLEGDPRTAGMAILSSLSTWLLHRGESLAGVTSPYAAHLSALTSTEGQALAARARTGGRGAARAETLIFLALIVLGATAGLVVACGGLL